MSESSPPAKSETSSKPSEGAATESAATESTSVDPERQKTVTADYRKNWNRIFNKQ